MQIEEQSNTPIDWTKPIEDTDGNQCKVISQDYKHGEERLNVVQIDRDTFSSVVVVRDDGVVRFGRYVTQIRNRKTKHEGWVVIFPDRWAGMIWRNKEDAQRHGDTKHAIDIVKIEWEE